jgi:hypothetical protein
MFHRNKTQARGKALRATRGVPGMSDLMMLAAALLLIVLPPYVSEAMAVGAARTAPAAPSVTEQRSVSGFDQVDWSASGDLIIEQTGRERLSIEAEPAVLAMVVTEVRDGRLTIGFGPGRINTRQPIRFRLEVRSLASFRASGSGDVRIGPLSANNVSIVLAGTDDVQIARLSARSLDVRIEGSGELTIVAGEVPAQRVVLSGSGGYAAPGLSSRSVQVNSTGSGDARVNASQRLEARIGGSGDVHFVGRPQVAASVDGSGTVRPAP